MITPLRHWSLNRTIPTIDDTESLSVLELVGKNTTKINEIVKDYNKFVDDINKVINEFENGLYEDFDCFKKKITKIVHDYIMMIDERIKLQDLHIDETIVYIKDNLVSYIKENFAITLKELIAEGLLEGDIFDELYAKFDEMELTLNNLIANIGDTANLSDEVKNTEGETSVVDSINNLNNLRKEDVSVIENNIAEILKNNEVLFVDFSAYGLSATIPTTDTQHAKIIEYSSSDKSAYIIVAKFSSNYPLVFVARKNDSNLRNYISVNEIENYSGEYYNLTLTVNTDARTIKLNSVISTIIHNNNTKSYNVTSNYHPAHKKYVDDEIKKNTSLFTIDLTGSTTYNLENLEETTETIVLQKFSEVATKYLNSGLNYCLAILKTPFMDTIYLVRCKYPIADISSETGIDFEVMQPITDSNMKYRDYCNIQVEGTRSGNTFTATKVKHVKKLYAEYEDLSDYEFIEDYAHFGWDADGNFTHIHRFYRCGRVYFLEGMLTNTSENTQQIPKDRYIASIMKEEMHAQMIQTYYDYCSKAWIILNNEGVQVDSDITVNPGSSVTYHFMWVR